MVNKFKKYVRLFLVLTRINFLQALEYRIDFITGILPTGTYSAAYIVFISSVLQKFPTIVGWNLDQMLVLFAVEQLLFYSSWLLYRRSLDNFSDLIRNGTFDFVAKMPVNSRFLMSFRLQSPDIYLPSIGSIAVLFYATRNLTLSPHNIFIFIVLVIFGIIILYNIYFALASLSFWTTDADEFIVLVDEIHDFGRYPVNIYPKFVGLILMTLLPVILIVYVPATAILQILNWKLVLQMVLVLVISFWISDLVWKKGTKHYSSASS